MRKPNVKRPPANQTEQDVKQELERKHAYLRDYYGNKGIKLLWDVTPEMKEKQLCVMLIKCDCDNKNCREITLILDAEEAQRYLRWV